MGRRCGRALSLGRSPAELRRYFSVTTEPHILLVEDNDDDAELTMRAFRQAGVSNRVVRAADGVEALDYLFGRGAFAGRDLTDLPAVVLLDLNLPRLTGLDVLKAIREDARTSALAVVVLTSSNEDRDRMAAYEHWANSYVRKPVDFEQFVLASRELGVYWTVLNLPAPRRGG
jgi:two-component system, response regulator